MRDVQAINAEASVLMKRGIALMDSGVLPEALLLFDRALALRSGLPIDTDPLLRFGLAACWLNRADALSHMKSNALNSYDEGIKVLGGLSLDADPRFPRRLAIAHQNRGLALQSMGALSEAIAAFDSSIAVLNSPPGKAIPDRNLLLATVLTNLALASRGKDPALRAIALVAETEMADPTAAEVGLKARHLLCQLVAPQLASAHEVNADDLHEATDAADDGLNLVRAWEKKGVVHLREIACDLFRFGSRVYAAYQPQFLSEFIAENADPTRSSVEYVESAGISGALEEATLLKDRVARRSSGPDE